MTTARQRCMLSSVSSSLGVPEEEASELFWNHKDDIEGFLSDPTVECTSLFFLFQSDESDIADAEAAAAALGDHDDDSDDVEILETSSESDGNHSGSEAGERNPSCGALPRHLSMTYSLDDVQLRAKCAYFVRNTTRAVNQKISSDEQLIFGELHPSQLLQTFESVLSNVFVPLLDSGEGWGKIASKEGRKLFLAQSDQFSASIKRNLSNVDAVFRH